MRRTSEADRDTRAPPAAATKGLVGSPGRHQRTRPLRLSASARVNVLAIASASAVVAALASASPVGESIADRFWCALAGALVPLVASRSRRVALLWAGGIAAVVAMGGDAVTIGAGIALLILVAIAATSKHGGASLGASIGAVAVQVFLRGPSYGPVLLPTLVTIVALAPIVVSAWRTARRSERRVVVWTIAGATGLIVLVVVGLGITVLRVRSNIESATAKATSGLTLLGKGKSEQATAEFDGSASLFTESSNSLDSMLAWPARFLPVAAQNLDALRAAASSGSDLAVSAANTSAQADYRLLTVQSGRIDLARIAAFEQPVASSLDTISTALDAIDAASSPWLLAPIDKQFGRLRSRLVEARDQADIALDGIRVAPELFGGDEPKRWFLSFGSSGESRNAGGFIGAYAILVADGGRLSLEKTGPIGELYRLRPPLYDFTPPPDWEERYSTYNVPVNLGNISVSPSWPVDASVMAQLYPQTSGGAPIDGAIYVDPAALAGLLSLTGAITVPGLDQRLDATNVEQYLLRDQYIEFASSNNQRKDILGDVASATFNAMTTRSLPSLSKIANVLGPIVAARHLQIASFAPTAESFLDRIGISGSFSMTPGSDYLSVRSANLLANKIDTFMNRSIHVDTQLDAGTGSVRSTVTVSLRNDAPANGLPPYLIGNDRGLPSGTNRTLVTIYSPHVLESVSVDGRVSGVQSQTEFGGPVYGVPVDVAPGTTVTVVFELTGAFSGRPYRFEVLPQATATPDLLTINLRGTGHSDSSPAYEGPLDRVVRVGNLG